MENLNCFVILAVVISLKVMRKDFQTSWGRQKIEKTKIVEKKKKTTGHQCLMQSLKCK